MTRFAGDIDLESFMSDFDMSKPVNATREGRRDEKITNAAAEGYLGEANVLGAAKVASAEANAEAALAKAAADADAKTTGAFTSALGGLFKSGISAFGQANNMGVYGK